MSCSEYFQIQLTYCYFLFRFDKHIKLKDVKQNIILHHLNRMIYDTVISEYYSC